MAKTKAEYERGLRAEHAAETKKINAERVAELKTITTKWKEGLAALKKENDALHLGATETYREEKNKNDL